MKRNLTANLAGTGWNILLQLLATPLYIRLLGAEAYGLIGFHTLMMGLLLVLDAGFSPAANYQAARLVATGTNTQELGSLARTLTTCGWCLGLLAGAGIISSCGFLADRWLQIQTLPANQVRISLVLLGVIGGLQVASYWPIGLIMGLERQIGLNILNMVTSTASHAGALLLIWRFHASVTAYFICQAGAALLTALALLGLLRQALPFGAWKLGRIRFLSLAPMVTYARDMGLVVICSVVLTQLDKVILSRILSLSEFGFYALASSAASAVRQLAMPVFNASLPRMSASVHLGRDMELAAAFWQATRTIALLAVPVTVVIFLESESVLRIWTGNLAMVRGASLPLRVLVVGASLNALLHVPYALQLACGYTSLIRKSSLLGLLVMVPSLLWAAAKYGTVGAASCWAGLNILNVFILVPIVHQRCLPGLAWPWIRVVLTSLALGLVVAWLALKGMSASPGVSQLAVTWFLSSLALVAWHGRALIHGEMGEERHAH